MSASTGSVLSQLPLGDGVELLETHPCGLLAFSKPSGVLSHPNKRGEEERSLLKASYSLDAECYQWKRTDGNEARLWLLNRLDSSTSGVLLGSMDEKLSLAVREHFRRRHIHKVYNALVFGAPSVPVQQWRDRLAIEKKGGQVRTSGHGNIPCESAMKLLQRTRSQPLMSLIELVPQTGRSHQLRVQCAMRGLPIVGDATYGDFGANRRFARECGEKRLFLHSLETRFEFEFAGRKVSFKAKAPLPEAFKAALR